MTTARTVAACALAITIASHRLEAQDLSRYRMFVLGTDLAAVSALTGVASSAAATVHQRPILLQDLTWRPSLWTLGSVADSTDPVEQVVFSFYNDRLFRIRVDYGHARTEGMTDADMIEGIAAVYGPVVISGTAPMRGSLGLQAPLAPESAVPIARWEDMEHAVLLYRTSSYGEAFRLIVTDLGAADLETQAIIQALKLDRQEAPGLELARRKKEQEEARTAAEQARRANKGLFRP
jgi:hypothetical protein